MGLLCNIWHILGNNEVHTCKYNYIEDFYKDARKRMLYVVKCVFIKGDIKIGYNRPWGQSGYLNTAGTTVGIKTLLTLQASKSALCLGNRNIRCNVRR